MVECCYASNLGKASNNITEAMSLLWDLKLTIRVGWVNVMIEGDSKVIIDMVKGNMKVGWEIRRVIKEVWNLLMILKHYDLQHIY